MAVLIAVPITARAAVVCAVRAVVLRAMLERVLIIALGITSGVASRTTLQTLLLAAAHAMALAARAPAAVLRPQGLRLYSVKTTLRTETADRSPPTADRSMTK